MGSSEGALIATVGIAILSSCAPAPAAPRCGGQHHPAGSASPEVDDSPANLDEAHDRLLAMLPAETLEAIRSGSEGDMAQYHFGLGQRLRNEWGLWGCSRLSDYFRGLGVEHPDDMSSILLDTFWCKLNKKPLRLAERVEKVKEIWEAQKLPKGHSPIDNAKIAWVFGPSDKPPFVHLGWSISDHSFWRYEYKSGRGIEPARPDEARRLDEELQSKKGYGKCDVSGSELAEYLCSPGATCVRYREDRSAISCHLVSSCADCECATRYAREQVYKCRSSTCKVVNGVVNVECAEQPE